MTTCSSILPWKIPWAEEPDGCSPWGRRVRHIWATDTFIHNIKFLLSSVLLRSCLTVDQLSWRHFYFGSVLCSCSFAGFSSSSSPWPSFCAQLNPFLHQFFLLPSFSLPSLLYPVSYQSWPLPHLYRTDAQWGSWPVPTPHSWPFSPLSSRFSASCQASPLGAPDFKQLLFPSASL